jgi:membrane-associated protease RseP (regulator of RpoE activity)
MTRQRTAPPQPTSTPEGARTSTEPVVVRPDAAPLRWVRRWRRAGDAEGRRHEVHPVRGVLVVLALVVLGAVMPGAVVFIGILAAIVVVHEGGHYLVARRCGMRPTEFFVGFGPTVIARTSRSGVRYGFKALLLGGYVKIPGIGPREEIEASLEPFTYRAATRPRRLAVILAGVAANLVLAVALFATFGIFGPGNDVAATRAVTASVGLTSTVAVETVSGLGRLVSGAQDYAGSVARGEPPQDRMMSAVGGAQLTEGLLEESPARLLLLAGLFSTAVAVLNLLPLLPLDGGHAALVVVEGVVARVRRRPRYRLDPNTFRPVAALVLLALVALGVSSMYIDVLHPVSLG